jgi:hypothetical protein
MHMHMLKARQLRTGCEMRKEVSFQFRKISVVKFDAYVSSMM